jgi:hypothetical protein
MKSMITAVVACGMVLVPSAVAAPSPDHGTGKPAASSTPSVLPPARCARGAAHAKLVTFVLRGKLSKYSAATTTQAGSVTMAVTGGNCFARALAGTAITFALSTDTRVVNGGSVSDGDRGAIQLRGAKTLDAAALAKVTPRLVIDQTAH